MRSCSLSGSFSVVYDFSSRPFIEISLWREFIDMHWEDYKEVYDWSLTPRILWWRDREINSWNPSMICRSPQWSLNKVLWKREEEELNPDEGGHRGGGCVLAGPWRVCGESIGGKRWRHPEEIRHSHVHLMVSFLEFRVHGGWDVVRDETRRQIKIVDDFNLQAKVFDLCALANGKPWKVLQDDSNVQPERWLRW